MYPYWRFHLSSPYVGQQQGIALVMTLMFVAVLTLVGSTAVTINSTDLLLGGAFQASQTAFHHADSGVRYVASESSSCVREGKLLLDGTKSTEDATFTPPSGFAFNVDRRETFKRIANTRKYLLHVTGHAHRHSPIKSTVEVVLQRRTALDYGLFAAARLDLPARGRILSYDSRRLSRGRHPTTSTGAVNMATNGVMAAQASHLDLNIDGDVILGATPGGEEAYFTFRDASPDVPPPPVKITTGAEHQHQINLLPGDALPTDPLDITEMVDAAQEYLRRHNDNDHVKLGNYRLTQSRRLNQGNYYFKEVTLGSGHFLWLDTDGGDINIYADSITIEGNARLRVVTDGRGHYGNVNIYLAGPASLSAQSPSRESAFKVTGNASTFRIFSSSSEPITLDHDGDFKGFIYAPHAPLTVRNTSAHGYGLLWGRTLDFSMNDAPYTFYTDTALQELFLSRDVEIVSWKELRD